MVMREVNLKEKDKYRILMHISGIGECIDDLIYRAEIETQT